MDISSRNAPPVAAALYVLNVFVVYMCIAISCGSQRQLVNRGLIPVVVQSPNLTQIHTVVALVLLTALWRPSGIYKCSVGPAAELYPAVVRHGHRSSLSPNDALFFLPLPCTHTHTHTLQPTLARVHIWRGRRQVVTPRWLQSGRLLPFFTCFGLIFFSLCFSFSPPPLTLCSL